MRKKSGDCGPMDIAIALDDTGSMGGAIENVKTELPSIINDARIASGDDLRLGYVTFKDNVTVHHPFTNNLALVAGSIAEYCRKLRERIA